MTPEAQRIAIAEVCGWKIKESDGYFAPIGTDGTHFGWWRSVVAAQNHLPDYLNDLNAMHEAEKVLKGGKEDEFGELAEYYGSLCLVCGSGTEPYDVYEIDLVRATAAQRAEAFLKTIGKWVDSPLASTAVRK